MCVKRGKPKCGVATSAIYSENRRLSFLHVHACSRTHRDPATDIAAAIGSPVGCPVPVAGTRKRDPAPCREPILLTRGRRTRSPESSATSRARRAERRRRLSDAEPLVAGQCPAGTLRRHTLDGAARRHGPARPRRGAWGLPTRDVPALRGFASTGSHFGQAVPASTARRPGGTPRQSGQRAASSNRPAH